MIKVVVPGVAGRMGSVIARLVIDDPQMELVGATELSGSEIIGKDVGEIIGKGAIGVKVVDSLERVADFDVLIDFTAPEATLKHVDFCFEHKKAMVIGTTGIEKEGIARIEKAASSIPVVFSPNMSVGVNLLFKLVQDVAKALGDEYDIEIVEVHHRFKKDAPSGTALKLAENIARSLGRNLDECGVYGRKGVIGERNSKEIAVFAVRAGDVVGEHTVIFGGLGERIELVHKAHSRETFARGAIRAVKWVYGKPAGLYSMWDVLGIS